MRKTRFGFTAMIAALALAMPGVTLLADDDDDDDDDERNLEFVQPGDLWQAPPFDFVFGNHMDTHIQLNLKTRRGEPKLLKGFLYIYFTGEIDTASGLPIARHPRGMGMGGTPHDEVCGVSPITCVAGWRVTGRPGAAKYLYHNGVNGNDHPVWMANRAEEMSAPTVGMVIPQPGYYSHFHWLSSGSTDPRAGDVPDFCDEMSAGALEKPDPDTGVTAVNEVCEGWFLQLRALRSFAFKHGGETIPIRIGADLRSHLNIVTNYRSDTVVEITPTRMNMGSH